MYYQVPIEISRQEDGLWRAEAPSLEGCWVDASTLESVLAQMPQVIAMVIDIYMEKGWAVPAEVSTTDAPPLRTSLTVALEEHEFDRRTATLAKELL